MSRWEVVWRGTRGEQIIGTHRLQIVAWLNRLLHPNTYVRRGERVS